GARGATAGVDAARLSARPAHEPERVAADGIHVRVDGGDGGCGCDHRLERVASLAQRVERGLRRQRVRRHGHAAAAGDGPYRHDVLSFECNCLASRRTVGEAKKILLFIWLRQYYPDKLPTECRP